MDIEVSTPVVAEAEIKKYTLVGDDIYVKRYTNNTVPDWYRQLISDIIATDTTITDLDAAIAYLETLPSGYNQQILNLQNADITINSSIESLITTIGSQSASIANLTSTKVDATGASAIALNTISTYFNDGSAGAWFNNQISTYSSDISANAMNISTLSAVVGNQAVSINTVENIAIEANEWSATASKLITSSDGSVTGWSFGDGSNIKNYFKVQATNFSISDGTTGYTPFSIVGSNIQFNGLVSFTNITDPPIINKTWVQNTEPSSDMVAGDTWIDTDDNNKMYSYDGAAWNPVGAGIKTYLQTTAPAGDLSIGDMWVDSDDNYKQYRYNGTVWVAVEYNPAIAINSGTTTINGGKITTGSVTANEIAANTITTNHISASGLNASVIKAGVIYNTGANESTYTMKISLDDGYIHIK